jgi:pyruvate formate lyase activating enzyme
MPVHKAMFQSGRDDGSVDCSLCPHHCRIRPTRRGRCRVRENRDGTLVTYAYGRTIAEHADPMEKKPLFHFLPGSQAYSMATVGCNMTCRWCQNCTISQVTDDRVLQAGRPAAPAAIVESALAAGCAAIAYTYTEPTIFFEYSYDTAQRAAAAGLANVYVTNGYITAEALGVIAPYLDAANVDLKSFRDETYRQYTGARLEPVLATLKEMKRLGIWVEVTTLIVPGINDDRDELRHAARFIVTELGAETPWHLSRFFPQHEMRDRPPTPMDTMHETYDLARTVGLRYVYLGNVAGEENTHCHVCNRVVVRRQGYFRVHSQVTAEGNCPGCGTHVAGIGVHGDIRRWARGRDGAADNQATGDPVP